MLTIPRDGKTIHLTQELLVQLFCARDSLVAASEVLIDEKEHRFIFRRLSLQLGGHAADLQQIVSASGMPPAEPQLTDDDPKNCLSSIKQNNGTYGVLRALEEAEQRLAEKYEQTLCNVQDREITGLLDKQREEIEFALHVLRSLKCPI